jgi:hypothetical protein
MTFHKLNVESPLNGANPLDINLALSHRSYDFTDTIVRARAVQTLSAMPARFPVYRRVRCKTKLVRAILAEMSRRKGESAEVMYTADRRTLEKDEVFVEFITGSHDAFVIEDADHMLMARSNGNVDLHRFLAVADGVVRAQGRKIIFTTNLPNLGDIDEALLRPGRCFASVRTRPLMREEAARLVARIGTGHASECPAVLERAFPEGKRSASLAEVFRACAM